MKNLNKYLEQKNQWRAIFKDRKLTLPLDAAIVRRHLESDMSPENLSMDGEASPSFVRKQYQFLDAAMQELEANYKVF